MNNNANEVFIGNLQFDRSPDFDTYGSSSANFLALSVRLSDAGREACPPEWLELSALLPNLIYDEGMTTEMVDYEAAVPVWLVAGYRAQMGI